MDEEDVSPDSTDPELLSSLRKNGDVSGNHPLPDVPNDTANGHDNSTKQSGAATVAGGGSESLHTWFQTQWSSNHPSNGENGQISQSVSAVAKAVAWRLFHNDLVTLVGMRDLWEDRQDRREPSPLDEATLNKAVATESGVCVWKYVWFFVCVRRPRVHATQLNTLI